MKRIFFIVLIFLSVNTSAQIYPITQNLGSPSTAVEDKGGLFVRGAFVPPQFVDTTAANAAPHTQFYAGSQINTTSDNLYWYRSNDLTKWIKMGSGSGDDTAYVSVALTADSSGFILYHSNRNIAPDTVDFVGGGGGGGIDSTALSDTLNNYASYGALTMPNVLYSTPIALSVSNHFLSGTFTGTNISQYQILGRKASGSGAYSFLTADSTLIPDLHSENYYNTKYGSGGGSVLSVTGSPSGLVDNTDPTNPIVQQDVLKLNALLVSGGAINQILKKNSSTDYDWSWQDEYNCDTCISTITFNVDSTIVYFIRVNGDTAKALSWSGVPYFKFPLYYVTSDSVGLRTDSMPHLTYYDTTSLSGYNLVTANWVQARLGGGGGGSSPWTVSGNNVYVTDPHVVVGASSGSSAITLSKAVPLSNTTSTPEDSLGVALLTSTSATVGFRSDSPPLIFGAKGWNTTSGTSQDVKFKTYAASGSSSSLLANYYIDYSANGGAYSHIFDLLGNGNIVTYGQLSVASSVSATTYSGWGYTANKNPINVPWSAFKDNTTIAGSNTLATYAGFDFNPTVTSGAVGLLIRGFQNTVGNNVFNRSSGNTSIGSDSAVEGAKLSVTSTTGAFLPPRMTKAQRDLLNGGYTGSITNAGTGTRANITLSLALTGGTGSGATASVTVTSNVISAVQILSYGTGYTAGDVLTGPVTGITGWTWTISAITPVKDGSEIYQTDNTPGPRVMVGGAWNKYTITADP